MSEARVSIDALGTIIAFDGAAEEMFGHRAPDVIGAPMVEVIIPEPLRPMHLDGMARFLRTGEAFLIGRTVEVMALHAGGLMFPATLSLVLESDDPLVITGSLQRA
jgi:PAS domain S-box-containing protein